jgi:hypothetical protein
MHRRKFACTGVQESVVYSITARMCHLSFTSVIRNFQVRKVPARFCLDAFAEALSFPSYGSALKSPDTNRRGIGANSKQSRSPFVHKCSTSDRQ